MEIATNHNQRQIKINTRLSLLLVSISIYKNYEPGLEVLEFCVISDECSYLALLGSFLSKFNNNRNSECQLFCCFFAKKATSAWCILQLQLEL